MSERIVHVIPNLQMKKYERKAVAIYARVSTAHSAQLHSVSLQLSVLVQRVYHTLNWQLADSMSILPAVKMLLNAQSFNV